MTLLRRGVVVAALFVLLGAVPVFAHAELDGSDPPDGGTITAPYTLTATFSEEIGTDRSQIVVTNAAGEEVARGGISVDDARVMTVDLPALDAGGYLASWTAVTPDDNGVTRGQFRFTVAPTPRTTASTPTPAATPTPVTPTPAPTPAGRGEPTASGTDILLALAIAAVVLLALGAYVFTRRR